jgi:hypothetical protein
VIDLKEAERSLLGKSFLYLFSSDFDFLALFLAVFGFSVMRSLFGLH